MINPQFKLIQFVVGCACAVFTGVVFAGTIQCEEHAAVVDGDPLDNSLYTILQEGAMSIDKSIYVVAPINGGRYWLRADYADGTNPVPYPHIGCFADIRVGISWVCGSDREFVKRRFGCNVQGRGQAVALPTDSCISLAVALRERVLYCAPGASPAIAR